MPRTLTLTGDRELMEYAFYNLLTNAVKYSPADRSERYGLRRKARPGCASRCRTRASAWTQKEVKKIFQKFYRTQKAEASGEAGTGIGLSIVEQIVAQHGGRDRSGERARQGLVLYPGIAGAAAAEYSARRNGVDGMTTTAGSRRRSRESGPRS